jgi:hypothetical protein
MKKLVSTLFAILLLTGAGLRVQAACDPGQDWREKVESEKIAFLSTEMRLTPDEAKVFWPLYNEAQNAKRQDFEKAVEAYKALQQALRSGADEATVSACLKAYLDSKGGADRIDREYVEKYRKVLPADKVARLYLAEEKFRREQIKKLHRGGPKPEGERK